MRLLRRIAGFLGFANHESHEVKDENEDNEDHDDVSSRVETHLPRKGFSVPVHVPVERAQVGPVVIPCSVGEGGVQGLRWYARRLRIDEDGDVADEFLEEVLPDTLSSTNDHHRPLPSFQVKYSTRPAKVRNQTLLDGKIQQHVEHHGRLQWV
ncbi:uncharacterized protein LOC132282844 [Cornus florida]|uniref:uncharacterized protein LOC132282844 n=1 Tax=Cornus florida TaxID=4283 RepID=UPI00289743CF|nr:uncharacterized protein LOC132282844 [Cornus florida]